ncbi:ABC transporter ATP-binding protein [Rhodococcus sp. NPDC058521]|uniref:ABC transporter ATP-binding protein n=1 Tax=Rhodococcus sp. NPDC058521 TaxID=3346536 RepID=UPI00365A130F
MSPQAKAEQAERPSVDLFRPVRGRIASIVILSLIGALASVVPFIAIVELARTLWPAISGDPVDSGRAWATVAVAAGSSIVGFAAAFSSGLVSHLVDNDLQLDLRRRIVNHLRTLPLGWFDSRSSGSVKKVAENDVSALHQLVAHAIQDVIMAVTIPVVALIYLFTVEWRMALVCIVPIVVAMALYPIMMSGGAEKYAEYDASVARLNAATIEYVHGIAVVKAFGQSGRSHGRYRDETRRFVGFYKGWMRETAVVSSLMELVTSPGVILVYLCCAGAALVNADMVAPRDVLAAFLLGLGLTAPLLQLGFSGQFLRDATKARESLTEFLAEPPIPQATDPTEPDGHEVLLKDVSFSYDGEHHVLHEIAAACTPGTVTALVGPSGSGKSTLARLVPRFYDVTDGSVSIGGADVREMAAQRLYAEVGFVFQDSYLLRTTVRDNIVLTRPGASEEQIESAARAAQIHDRILRLPRGYDSVIGEDAHLSGGEGQRLTIARALLTDAPILVLDEATAFADPDSEAAIQTALSALAQDRTLLVIAHRLHTITGVEQILVLDDGRIIERGSHAQLVEAGGQYQSMWQRYQASRTATTPQGVHS